MMSLELSTPSESLSECSGEHSCRTGIRVRGQRVDPEIRGIFIRFCRWLRTVYSFPKRVPVYLFPYETIITQDGNEVSASFFAPENPEEEPFIRVATGDFYELTENSGRDDAAAALLCSLAHEIVHYFQWIETGTTTERGVAVRARNIVWDYASVVDAP